MTAMDIINAGIAKLAENEAALNGQAAKIDQRIWNHQVNLLIHLVSVANEGWGERTCAEYVIERMDDIRCAAL